MGRSRTGLNEMSLVMGRSSWSWVRLEVHSEKFRLQRQSCELNLYLILTFVFYIFYFRIKYAVYNIKFGWKINTKSLANILLLETFWWMSSQRWKILKIIINKKAWKIYACFSFNNMRNKLAYIHVWTTTFYEKCII